jgi:hypothetical protein
MRCEPGALRLAASTRLESRSMHIENEDLSDGMCHSGVGDLSRICKFS